MIPEDIQLFHQKLHKWYAKHGRHELPWRQNASPYEVLVSEMMLQQTQVGTVLARFYHPFLAAFSNPEALAEASLEEVMQKWQGLGYYRRAKFLHQAAKLAGKALPDNFDALIKLPGIGRNTAHAVLAFGFGQPYAVMEANVKRILCRIYALETPKNTELWHYAAELLDEAQPFDYNQAMMDVGAMVCRPKAPLCDECPAAHMCKGKEEPELYPHKLAKKAIPVRRQKILVVRDTSGNIYASARDGEFLHGLYQFIELAEDADAVMLNGQHVSQTDWHFLGEVQQTYSHFKQVAKVYSYIYSGEHKKDNWYSAETFEKLPISGKEKKILSLIKNTPPVSGAFSF